MNITINERNHTLEITKKFATAASRFGSDEYRELKEARTEFPTFKVVVKTTKSKNSFNGLTYAFMENYIKSHDDEKQTKYAEFMKQREIGKSVASAKAYNEIKKWFLEKYPEIAEFAA